MASRNSTPAKLSAEAKAALQNAVKTVGTQVAVAKKLGVSPTVISQLLSDRYPGDVPTMEQRIRGEFMAETVTCPVMGQLGRQHCLEYQAQPLRSTNPQRARLFKACKTCPNRKEST